MAGDEDQAEKVAADGVVESGVEVGRGLFEGFEFAGEAGDHARGLDAPYGFDGAMEDLMWIGSGHCYRSHQPPSVDARAAIC